jgi:hypothetical protein
MAPFVLNLQCGYTSTQSVPLSSGLCLALWLALAPHELVRDLVLLIKHAKEDDSVQVLVFRSADPDYSCLTST